MRCPLKSEKSSELVVGYGARTLDSETASAFEDHLSSCSACCRAAAAQRAVWEALDEWRELPVSPDFDRRLFQRIQASENRAWWLWRMLLPMAACLALAAVLLLRQPAATPPPQIQQVEHALDDMDMLNQLGAEI